MTAESFVRLTRESLISRFDAEMHMVYEELSDDDIYHIQNGLKDIMDFAIRNFRAEVPFCRKDLYETFGSKYVTLEKVYDFINKKDENGDRLPITCFYSSCNRDILNISFKELFDDYAFKKDSRKGLE